MTVTFCWWPPLDLTNQASLHGRCGQDALPGLLMVAPEGETLPFCGEHADAAWKEGWTRFEQICNWPLDRVSPGEFDRPTQLCGLPATGVVLSGPGTTIWSRRACPDHLAIASVAGYKIRPLGPWSDEPQRDKLAVARDLEALHLRLGLAETPEQLEHEAQIWERHGFLSTADALRREIEHGMSAPPWPESHQNPVSAAPRPLPRGYASRPGVASVLVLGAAVGFTVACWAWCWARDFIRGLVGPG